MIVVLDTSVIVTAAVRRQSDPDNLVRRASRGEFELAMSPVLLAEVERVLAFERLQPRLQWSGSQREEFVMTLRDASFVVEPAFELHVVRDPKDNRVVEAAIEADAEFIVSTDNDLLDLRQYETVTIVTPAEFLRVLLEEPRNTP